MQTELTHTQEALLKKRKRDDMDQRRRVDARAKQKLDQGRHKKLAEKEKAGGNVLMPEVFVSNHMKQQRNYVHYKRNKSTITLAEKATVGQTGFGFYDAATKPENRVKENSLLLVCRIKGYNTTTPQSQKILSEIGLRQINNAVFVRADDKTIKKLMLVNDYVAYGYPSKKMVKELVTKRGFLRKDEKKEPITNNVTIEELFSDFNKKTSGMGCICIEDIIDNISNCHKPDNFDLFDEIISILWPLQLGSLKETMAESNMKHDATGREIRKKNTKVEKGGYIGFMSDRINDFIKPLI